MTSRLARLPVVALMGLVGFWAGDVLCGYASVALPGLSSAFDGGSAPVDLWAYVTSGEGPLGLSFERLQLLCGVAAAALVVLAASLGGPRDDHMIRPEEQTGSNRLGGPADYAKYEHGKSTPSWPKPAWCETLADDNILISGNCRVALSDNPDRNCRPSNRHTFVMAGSGAGKTYNYVTSNVLQLNASYVFSDPKRELFARFANLLVAHGYVVKVIDLTDDASMRASDHYDPFRYAKDMTEVEAIAETFIKNTTTSEASSSGNSEFFENMEKMGYCAIYGLELFYFAGQGSKEDFTLPSALDFVALLKAEGDAAESALDRIFYGTEQTNGVAGYRQFLDEQVLPRYASEQDMRARAPEWQPMAAYEGLKSASGSPEEMAGVVSSMYNRLRPFMNPTLRQMTSDDTLELDRLGKRKTAIFLCIPDTGGPYDFLAAMVASQVFRVNVRVADADVEHRHHLPIPVICYFDELANIGRIPRLGELFNTLRSRWINLVAITQYSDQLKVAYKEAARSVEAACSLFVYLGCGDYETCERLSKMIGEKTVRYEETSVSRSQSGSSTSVSSRWIKVPILSASELYTAGLDKDESLVKVAQDVWVRDSKPDPQRHPRWRELQEAGETDLATFRASHPLPRGHPPTGMRARRAPRPVQARVDFDAQGTPRRIRFSGAPSGRPESPAPSVASDTANHKNERTGKD